MTVNLLPLESFRYFTGYNQFHFWQLTNSKVPVNSACNTLVKEHAWQSAEAAGRAEMREAIAEAEERMVEQLHFDTATRYREETIDVGYLKAVTGAKPQPFGFGNSYGFGWGFGSPLYSYPYGMTGPALADLAVGKLQKIATVSWTALDLGTVSFSDTDGDGLNDTFTATITNSTVTDLSTVGIFFQDSDQPLFLADREFLEWQIRPVKVTRPDASTLKVTGPAWLLVKPARYEGVGQQPGYDYSGLGADSTGGLDPSDTSNFVSQVAFYQKTYTNENVAWLDYDDHGTVTSVQVYATISDHETGEVRLDLNNSANLPVTPSVLTPSITQRVRINYEAGDTQYKDWPVITTRLALAQMRRRLCACEQANIEWETWQHDLARVATKGTEGYRVDTKFLGNPLGTRQGHAQAWNVILSRRFLRGISN